MTDLSSANSAHVIEMDQAARDQLLSGTWHPLGGLHLFPPNTPLS